MKNEFDNKAKEYAMGRPTYPKEILNKLKELGIEKQSMIADIGAGTGIFTNTNIKYINATAENTELKENSVDIITIAQVFHWIDKQLSKAEFKRILKKNGYVGTLWNDRQVDSEFQKEYLNIVNKHAIKTTAGNSYFNPDKEKFDFFGQDYSKVYFDNWQSATEEQVICNALSISFTPSKLDSHYDKFVQDLHNLFVKFKENEKVMFHYKTELCICQFLK